MIPVNYPMIQQLENRAGFKGIAPPALPGAPLRYPGDSLVDSPWDSPGDYP